MKYKKPSTILLKLNAVLLLFTTVFASEKIANNIEFSFGVIADCQYSSVEDSGLRKYSLSESKLKDCVEHLNTMNLEFVIHLGDFIDEKYTNFDVVQPIYDRLNIPRYHVLGNHDFEVEDSKKEIVYKKLGMPSKYDDFEVKGWRFIVLDGNDISFHAYPKNSEKYVNAIEYYEQETIKSPEWNGAIGAKQLSWLKTVLKEASRKGENVVLFSHFPIYPDDIHNLWNAHEIIELIEHYNNVKAYINGHNHAGNYGVKNGVHYLTIKGMVETEKTSYAIVNIYETQIEVFGYGREESRVMTIKE
ncbi:MAG: metallophosphoesterase [bacterium]|nr:MAG: metallophosphoesterase [bacterium]